jgi:hypothetical protein
LLNWTKPCGNNLIMTPQSPQPSSHPPLVSPQHVKTRTALRVAGPAVLALGVIFTATAFIDFALSMNDLSRGSPRLFWCAFVGMPLLFVGTVLCMGGFLGSVARYTAAESAPVAADTFDYMAEHTQDGVKTVAKAMAQGVAEGLREGRPPEPPPRTM